MSLESELKEVFERIADEVEPGAAAWPATRDRIVRSHKRRLAAGGTLFLAVAAVLAVTVPRLLNPRAITVAPPSAWTTYQDPDYGWTLEYPSSWHSQQVSEEPYWYTRALFVSNIDHRFRHPAMENGGSTSAWDIGGLPSNFVVLLFGKLDPGSFGRGLCPSSGDTSLPLSLTDAQRGPPDSSWGAPQPPLYQEVSKRGHLYRLWAWVGPDASSTDREILDRIVASISFDKASPHPPAPTGGICDGRLTPGS